MSRSPDESSWGWQHLVGLEPVELIAMAKERVMKLGLDGSTDHRNVVNMLRHEFTGYDGHVQRFSTSKLYDEILDAIAADFPWLAAQCLRDKTTHDSRLPPWVQARRSAHEAAEGKQRAARMAIKDLAVGDAVRVRWRGLREGRVVELRRSRVRVSITMPDGSDRIIDRSADELEIGR